MRGDGGKGAAGGRVDYSRYNRDYRTSEDREFQRTPSPLWDFDGDHLYGISTIRAALISGQRNLTELLVQQGMDVSNKKDQEAAEEILDRARKLSVPIKEYSKHDLNMLSDNRPHQGFVLRASPLQFRRKDGLDPSSVFKCVLALDEVWDPQNFGALLRTSHFLNVDSVVVCAKNSAPLSPTVSKASSGALEIMNNVFSTDNLMRFLDKSIENGWQVVGTKLDPTALNLVSLPLDKPTILVLGNDGHGILTNILRRCTHLIKIPGGSDNGVVDSLNVSVTGGILLHHILSQGTLK